MIDLWYYDADPEIKVSIRPLRLGAPMGVYHGWSFIVCFSRSSILTRQKYKVTIVRLPPRLELTALSLVVCRQRRSWCQIPSWRYLVLTHMLICMYGCRHLYAGQS
jgi:hypothetical protein